MPETYFKPHPDGKRLVASFVPQVGFATSEHAEPVLFSEADLTADIVSQYAGYEVLVLAETEDDFQRLTAKISAMGCQADTVLWWHPDTSLPLVLEPVQVDYRLDEGVFRTIGKIAFNYLAHAAGADFCLSRDFDGFRRYARYGEGEWQSFISLSHQPLLSDERRTGTRVTRGHLLVAEWPRTSDVPTVSVKLFNDILYKIRFAGRVSMLWRELRAGHHFNFKTPKIQPITIVDLLAP